MDAQTMRIAPDGYTKVEKTGVYSASAENGGDSIMLREGEIVRDEILENFSLSDEATSERNEAARRASGHVLTGVRDAPPPIEERNPKMVAERMQSGEDRQNKSDNPPSNKSQSPSRNSGGVTSNATDEDLARAASDPKANENDGKK